MREKNKILRVIDVNFNRSKEGLRVVEDIFRFINEDDSLRTKARQLRHRLNNLSRSTIIKKAISQRNTLNDPGKSTDEFEMERTTTTDVLYVNIQRVKESMRVLEEFFKIIAPKRVSFIKSMRYELYTLEKTILLEGMIKNKTRQAKK